LAKAVKIHPIGSITEIALAPSDPLPGQVVPPPPPVTVDGYEEHVVEEVLDSGMFRKEPQYLVRWAGYQDPTWNKAEYMIGLTSVKMFHERYPGEQGPWEFRARRSSLLCVTGALCRKTDPKIATAPKTQSRSQDQNKDKDNSK